MNETENIITFMIPDKLTYTPGEQFYIARDVDSALGKGYVGVGRAMGHYRSLIEASSKAQRFIANDIHVDAIIRVTVSGREHFDVRPDAKPIYPNYPDFGSW